MNSHFNRQFILLDFRLLEDRNFLTFLGSSEFATYLVLRRNVWRSEKRHYMGLEKLYREEHRLCSSLTREKISAVTGVAADNISRHLSALARKGIIQRRATGRQNIYVLGEWVDVKGDGSYKVEWFYMEGVFGVSKSDLMLSVRSDPTMGSDQSRRRSSDTNRNENREGKTVGNGFLRRLPDLRQPKAKTDYVAQEILNQLKDEHSKPFYRMVAAKVPEEEIRRILAEVKVDGADHPAKLFTHKIGRYAVAKKRTTSM